jgi:hypothetical protein
MVGSSVSSSEQITIAQAVQLTGLHENTIRRFIKKSLATDPKANHKIIRTRRCYRLDRAYLLAGVGQVPPATAGTTQNQPRHKRKTVKLTLWVKPAVKREFQRIAAAEGLTLSRTGAAALEEWLARRSHIQHRGIFQPMIERAIAKEMRAYSSRIAILLVRSMFESGQTRTIVANILGKQQGVTQEMLDHVLDYSRDVAKRNITRITPQLASLITEVEQWLLQGEAQPNEG